VQHLALYVTIFGFSAAPGNLHDDFNGDMNVPRKHCCATLSIVIHLTVTCGSATHTHTHRMHFVFPLQQWLRERVTMLRYTCIACLGITETECVYCAVRTESFNVIEG
jgi:hypothetical protein